MNEFYALVDAIVQEVRAYFENPYASVTVIYMQTSVQRSFYVYAESDTDGMEFADLNDCLTFWQKMNEERNQA